LASLRGAAAEGRHTERPVLRVAVLGALAAGATEGDREGGGNLHPSAPNQSSIPRRVRMKAFWEEIQLRRNPEKKLSPGVQLSPHPLWGPHKPSGVRVRAHPPPLRVPNKRTRPLRVAGAGGRGELLRVQAAAAAAAGGSRGGTLKGEVPVEEVAAGPEAHGAQHVVQAPGARGRGGEQVSKRIGYKMDENRINDD